MTTLVQPIAKLYKRCAWNKHEQCPGSFETWSICSCQCHAGVSDERPAPHHYAPFCKICQRNVPCEHLPAVTCADKVEAVAAAVAIVATPKPAKVKASGLSTKTDKYAKWANAIVAKNARLETAWQEVKDAKGLVLSEGVPQSRMASMSDNGTHHCPMKAGATYCEQCRNGK